MEQIDYLIKDVEDRNGRRLSSLEKKVVDLSKERLPTKSNS